ncbi:MAG: signal recognition particle protein [Erysipelotrichales bacterium]|nr:signal recognition particle protein [Erysipelotrichales bacterium]
MAFEALGDKLQTIFKKITGKARLNENNIDEMLKEVKIALLDADVNIDVVKDFIEELKTKMIGQQVPTKLNPAQTVIKIVAESMTDLLGGATSSLNLYSNKQNIIMMVGLQGGGKTTSSAKLAHLLVKKYNKNPLLVACDVYRPAAIDQLEQLAKDNNFNFYSNRNTKDVIQIVSEALNYALSNNLDPIIIDTAGRLHIDDELMEELKLLKQRYSPQEILLVVDAMSGQAASISADAFNKLLSLTGVIMTKLDGDARGGAALSIAKVSRLKIKFSGIGEKINDLEEFHPSRMAERILGMGDLQSLIEKAQENVDEKKAKTMMGRMMSGRFDLEDLLYQMESANKMGPLGSIAKLLPGAPKLSEADQLRAEQRMKKSKAVIYSMTIEERKNPDIIRSGRKERIAKGSGLTTTDVNNVLRQYEQTKTMMKQMSSMFKGGKFPKM